MRTKSGKGEDREKVVKNNEKLQMKTASACANLKQKTGNLKKPKQVKLNIKKVSLLR